jgi:hypothetical protein
MSAQPRPDWTLAEIWAALRVIVGIVLSLLAQLLINGTA